ncbi:MAG: ATP-binding protein, partial [Spirulinaceae cyanobacterium]
MKQVFGDYGHNLPATQEYLILQFSPSSVPIKKRWRNNGLSADFLGDYLTTFFLNNEIELNEMEHQAEIKGAVSYIANELLENAMKFNDEEKDYPISISLHFHRDRVVFSTTNSISSQYQDKLKVFINKLATYDPQELYILQLEENAQGD